MSKKKKKIHRESKTKRTSRERLKHILSGQDYRRERPVAKSTVSNSRTQKFQFSALTLHKHAKAHRRLMSRLLSLGQASASSPHWSA